MTTKNGWWHAAVIGVGFGCVTAVGQPTPTPTPTPITPVPVLLPTAGQIPARLGLKIAFPSLVTSGTSRDLHAVFGYTTTATGTDAPAPASVSTSIETCHATVDGTPHYCVSLNEGYAYVRLNPAAEEDVALMRERACFSPEQTISVMDYIIRRGQVELGLRQQDKTSTIFTRTVERVMRGESPIAPGDEGAAIDQAVGAHAYIWWPIVVTHTIVAGADGTEVLARSVRVIDKHTGQQVPGAWDVWVFLMDGPSTLVSYRDYAGQKEQAFIGKAGDYLRFRVETIGGHERAKLVDDAGADDSTGIARTPSAGGHLDVFMQRAKEDFDAIWPDTAAP